MKEFLTPKPFGIKLLTKDPERSEGYFEGGRRCAWEKYG